MPPLGSSVARWSTTVAVLLLMGSYVPSAAGLDSICSAGDAKDGITEDEIRRFVHDHSMPLGGKQAGTYQKSSSSSLLPKVPELTDWIDCLVMCCEVDTCDVVFFFNDTCYLINCNASFVNGCLPIEKTSSVASKMVMVRPPVYSSNAVTTLPTTKPPRAVSDSSISDGGGKPGETPQPISGARGCEYGLKQCPENEDCVLGGAASSRSRQGSCQCRKTFERDAKGLCRPSTLIPLSTTPSPGDTKASKKPEDQSGKTTTPQPETPKMTKLTVSAGENKVLQLPDNSITLSAFVLPKAKQDEEYHYEWSPIGQPEGSEERATMQGKNTNTLKLSILIAGLYQMKVQVTAENKFGQAFVNVTVLPPKRKNKPPVAIITPASQKVKSENSFILDGSDSKDDDGITTYHWEEVSGPLQEHQLDGDTQTLKLKDMAPGFYVFRLTVTDTDGATNSTSANVTVIKETDYPPKANAGSDVIIHLPRKSVTLCGNASTDDKGIATYEWIKKSDTLTADMTGVRTVCLHLNNLEIGDYTFTLKVTDTGGKTGTADVHVYVKQETNQPPQAHTAGEITVMLPSESLVLDGKGSTDDKKVVKYKWTQTGRNSSFSVALEAILEICAPEAILEICAPEAILEICAPEAILEICAPEAILEVCAPEAILEVCAPEAILEVCAPEAILEVCAPEAILEVCAPEAILEVCAPEAILEVCTPEAILEMYAPEAILEMCAPEAILEVCAPEAILEMCAPEAILEMCAPEAILEMFAPEAILEMCAPEAILEMCAPEAILEMSAPAAILEICAPEAILEVCAPEAILEMCAPEAILEMCAPEAILEV
ncbi:hypothetical protein ACOMHN_014919 [Nucella lapillus]